MTTLGASVSDLDRSTSFPSERESNPSLVGTRLRSGWGLLEIGRNILKELVSDPGNHRARLRGGWADY